MKPFATLPHFMTIEITTQKDETGHWSYSFEYHGSLYAEHDFVTEESAKGYARSHIRSVSSQCPCGKPGRFHRIAGDVFLGCESCWEREQTLQAHRPRA